jgi:hypothetical protein
VVRSSENGKWFKKTLYRKSRNIFCVQFFRNYFLCNKATGKNIIRRMRFACWREKSTNKQTLTIFNTYCFSTVTTVTWTHLNIQLSVHCVYCCSLNQQSNQHSQYLTFIAITQPQPLHERTSMFSYPYIVSIVVVSISNQTNTTLPAAHGNSWSNSLRTSTVLRNADQNFWAS